MRRSCVAATCGLFASLLLFCCLSNRFVYNFCLHAHTHRQRKRESERVRGKRALFIMVDTKGRGTALSSHK